MRLFHEPISFEWDQGNFDKNLEKHGVSNQEAEDAFFHQPQFIFEDLEHSSLERKYLLWGTTAKGRMLSIIFTLRGNKIRIISTRNMSRKERRTYEEKVKADTEI